jgi:3-deoxy-D-manno-octulosonic-acid transferase
LPLKSAGEINGITKLLSALARRYPNFIIRTTILTAACEPRHLPCP